MYAYVEGGVVANGPTVLPSSWRNVSGLNLMSDAELAAIGWLPVDEVRPPLGRYEEYQDTPVVAVANGRVTITHVPYVRMALHEVRIAAYADIDAAAGAARARYMTVAYGQESTYLLKAADAHAYRSGGYVAANIDQHPWVKAKAEAMTDAPGPDDYQYAANLILSVRDAWFIVGVDIEREREKGKAAVAAALDAASVASVTENAISVLEAL